MKYCSKCKTKYNLSYFCKNKSRKDGLSHYCKACRGVCLEKHLNKSGIKYKENVKNNKINYPEKWWGYDLKKKYGIGADEYNEIFLNQNGNCAICGINQSKFKKRLFVDHNHATGKVRGLLCSQCNSLLGYAKEDLSILNKSINYLIKHK